MRGQGHARSRGRRGSESFKSSFKMAALDGAVVSTFTTEETAPPGHGRLLSQGAEARVFELQMLGRPCVAKQRFRKRWARARERRARALSLFTGAEPATRQVSARGARRAAHVSAHRVGGALHHALPSRGRRDPGHLPHRCGSGARIALTRALSERSFASLRLRARARAPSATAHALFRAHQRRHRARVHRGALRRDRGAGGREAR